MSDIMHAALLVIQQFPNPKQNISQSLFWEPFDDSCIGRRDGVTGSLAIGNYLPLLYLLLTGKGPDSDDEVMLNVLRCQLTY